MSFIQVSQIQHYGQFEQNSSLMLGHGAEQHPWSHPPGMTIKNVSNIAKCPRGEEAKIIPCGSHCTSCVAELGSVLDSFPSPGSCVVLPLPVSIVHN